MSDSNDHPGFTFQISETPPPARTGGRTPLADLVLDMGDFGQVRQASPLPPREVQRPPSAWMEPPVELAEVPAKVSTEPDQQQEEPAKANVASPISKTVKTQAPAQTSAPAPKIKKISFPVVSAPGPAPGRVSSNSRAQSKTKFAPSIGGAQPRPVLDSEPEEEEIEEAAGPRKTEMAPPEDLPGADQEFLPELGDSSWGSDTPSAREIWKKARVSWHEAAQHAVALSGQGLRASKVLADTVHEKVKERMRDASEERAARAHLKSTSGTGSQGHTGPEGTSHRDAPASAEIRRPSMAGRIILGLARTAGPKLAAPASALAAAAVVYFVGSQLLGASAGVALSKVKKGPEIPELGTLETGDEGAKDEKDDAKASSPSEKAPKSEKSNTGAPPPMETEVAEMPQGMSWPGKGLIEVVTSQDELVYVDGVFTGRGPLRRIPVSPGEHEVSIRTDGGERKGSVTVQAGKNTRAVFKGI